MNIKGELSPGSWRRLITSIEWHTLSLDKFPGWHRPNDIPYHFYLKHIHGGAWLSSREIAIEWDDLATGCFWYRDITQSSLPFVDESETYWSFFGFQFKGDWEKFKQHFGDRITTVDELPII